MAANAYVQNLPFGDSIRSPGVPGFFGFCEIGVKLHVVGHTYNHSCRKIKDVGASAEVSCTSRNGEVQPWSVDVEASTWLLSAEKQKNMVSKRGRSYMGGKAYRQKPAITSEGCYKNVVYILPKTTLERSKQSAGPPSPWPVLIGVWWGVRPGRNAVTNRFGRGVVFPRGVVSVSRVGLCDLYGTDQGQGAILSSHLYAAYLSCESKLRQAPTTVLISGRFAGFWCQYFWINFHISGVRPRLSASAGLPCLCPRRIIRTAVSCLTSQNGSSPV